MSAQTLLLELLNSELGRAKRTNPSYSLRSFARRLGLQPSTLSDILNGKRLVTRRTGEKILGRLHVDPLQAEKIKKALKSKYSSLHQEEQIESAQFHQLTSDQFQVLSNWFILAIRSLSETRGFQENASWIAKRLNISSREAQSALQRLERLGLVERSTKGQLQSTDVQLTTTHDIHDASIRHCHAQYIDLARESLELSSVEERDITGITMAIDPKKIPEAKARIREFRRELCNFLESGEKTEVYRLNVQLFPLSQETP